MIRKRESRLICLNRFFPDLDQIEEIVYGRDDFISVHTSGFDGSAFKLTIITTIIYLERSLQVRILLVEDEPDAARMLAKGLREQSFAVDIAPDGDTALEQVSFNEYDLVLLDVMLPGRDGFEICRNLRQAGFEIPVLMLTARDAVEDRIEGLDTGADDYLTKPFDFHELMARVRALLRRGPALRPDVMNIADLAINTRSRQVSRAGASIELTAKEYALLEYLARRAGEVVTRSDIAEHVWDRNFDPFSNLIEVYIQRLRRKIDEKADLKLIRTRRGEGYMITSGDEDSTV